MKVIAERDKILFYILTVAGVICLTVGISLLIVFLVWWYSLIIVFGAIFLSVGLRYGLMPKTAILQKDGDFIFCFFLRQKTIPVDSIQFVHYPEIGTFANRGNDIFSSLHILKHDIRTLTITYTENGAARQFHLVCIRDASAAAAAIDSIVKQHRRT